MFIYRPRTKPSRSRAPLVVSDFEREHVVVNKVYGGFRISSSVNLGGEMIPTYPTAEIAWSNAKRAVLRVGWLLDFRKTVKIAGDMAREHNQRPRVLKMLRAHRNQLRQDWVEVV